MKTFSFALVLGLFGAVAVGISSSLQWPTWVMFLAWVSYYLFGKSIKAVLLPFAQIVLGIVMGSLILLSGTWLSAQIGGIGFPLAVFFFIGSLAYIIRFTRLKNIPAWFVGLIIFFGVHPEILPVPLLSLLIPIAAGLFFAWANDSVVQKLPKQV